LIAQAGFTAILQIQERQPQIQRVQRYKMIFFEIVNRSGPCEVQRTEINRSEEHTSELQSLTNLVCRLLLEKKNRTSHQMTRTRPYCAALPTHLSFFVLLPRPPRSPLFPYTTLFRSLIAQAGFTAILQIQERQPQIQRVQRYKMIFFEIVNRSGPCEVQRTEIN